MRNDYILIPDNLFDLNIFKLMDDEQSDEIIVFWLRLYTMGEKRTKDGYPFISVANIELDDSVINILTNKKYGESWICSAMHKLIHIGVIRREQCKIIVLPPWLRKRDRTQDAYKKWRTSVFERDGFMCRQCGSKNGLNAHHIAQWAKTEEGSPLRFDINNGVTLCKDCHFDAHGRSWR